MTMIRSSCLRAVSWCLLWLWLTAAWAEGARALPVPRRLTATMVAAEGAAAQGVEAQGADRSLHIRSIPAFSGYTSNLFEVLMHPYHFEVPALTAVAALAPGNGAEGASGTLMLWQPHPPLGPLVVAGNLTGLPAATKLLLQVKRWGDMTDGCDGATGPPYDPFAPEFAGPPPPGFRMPPALGDVGMVETAEDGSARVHLLSHALALSGAHSVLGRAIALRPLPAPPGDKADGDTGEGDKAMSIACGAIVLTRYQPPPPPPPPPTPPPPPPKNPDAMAGEAESLNSP